MTALRPYTPLAYRLLPKRWFYGWTIAAGCAAMMMVTAGVGYYGLAVFLDPLQQEHGWSNSAVSGATSVYFLFSGVVAAFIGPYVDRNGPFRYMVSGILVIGGAAAAVGYVQELWHLYAVYTVMAAGFGLASGVSINAIMTRWFVRRRARAMSISATGVSMGGVILTPIGAWLAERGGLELAAPVLGGLVIVLALPVALFVLVFDPRQMGMLPDGDRTQEEADAAVVRNPALSAESQHRVWTRAEAVRTVSFWAILVAFVLVLVAQTGFVIHQISFLEDRLGSRSAAAFALSITAGGSIIARLVVGSFADAVDKRWLTFAIFVVQATAVILVLLIENVAATYVLILVFGFTIGNVYMMQGLLAGDIFGMVSFGTVFGLFSMAGQTGSGLGPFAVGWIEQQVGSYETSFLVMALITYLAAVVVLFARPVAPRAAVEAGGT